VSAFSQVQEALAKAGVATTSAEIAMLPKTTVDLDLDTGKKVVRLMEMLDDHDDVQNVYANGNLTEAMLAG
jgi:transcriptional/translational regulatory protein YebC/TACO1